MIVVGKIDGNANSYFMIATKNHGRRTSEEELAILFGCCQSYEEIISVYMLTGVCVYQSKVNQSRRRSV
jgi:hypothetical protein